MVFNFKRSFFSVAALRWHCHRTCHGGDAIPTIAALRRVRYVLTRVFCFSIVHFLVWVQDYGKRILSGLRKRCYFRQRKWRRLQACQNRWKKISPERCFFFFFSLSSKTRRDLIYHPIFNLILHSCITLPRIKIVILHTVKLGFNEYEV